MPTSVIEKKRRRSSKKEKKRNVDNAVYGKTGRKLVVAHKAPQPQSIPPPPSIPNMTAQREVPVAPKNSHTIPASIQFIVPPLSQSESKFSKDEKAYLAELSEDDRCKLLQQLDVHDTASVPLRFRIARSRLPNRSDILHKLNNRCEGSKLETYAENALKLPIDVFDRPPDASEVPDFLASARRIMDVEIYGQEQLKDHTVRALCSWVTNPENGGLVLGLEGPAGVGKTSYAKALGRIMNRPICSISLGGLNDVSVLVGHSYSYESSMYGQLAQCLMDCKSCSPVIVFDEVDKLGDTLRAQEIESLLIHLTDPNSNADVRDRYFQNIPLDFSRACMVFTMNDSRRVSPILLDRLTMVRMSIPSTADKVAIARNFIIPREVRRVRTQLDFDVDAVWELVRVHSDEQGVRGLARAIRNIVETLNVAQRGGLDALQSVKLRKISGDSGGVYNVSVHLVSQILEDRSERETGQPTHTMMYS